MPSLAKVLAVSAVAAALGLFSGIDPWVVTAQGSGNLIVDLWQTFEFDSLTTANLDAHDGVSGLGSWSIAGASAFSIATASEKFTPGTINSQPDLGSRGLAHNGSTRGDARVQFNFNSTLRPTSISFGVWFNVGGGFVGSYDEHDIFVIRRNLGGSNFWVKVSDDEAPRIFLFAENRDYSPGITIAPDRWYWITGKWVLNSDLSLRVYDDAGRQVGAEQRYTGSAVSDRITLVSVGSFIGPNDSDTRGALRFDDVVLDWTRAVYPLLPGQGGVPITPPTAPTNVKIIRPPAP
jgi:hypothetical protein